MEKFFKFKEKGTTLGTEIIAGLTTFFAMAYIIFVNPSILANAGMSWTGVFVATVLATVLGTLLIGLLANIPYAQAPGMGLNAFFTYTVCSQLGFVWQEALAMVFICGVVGIIITATRLRSHIIIAVPSSLRNAIGAGIGLFIAYIGLKNGGILQFVDTSEGFTAGAAAVPGLVNFTDAAAQLTLVGIAITIVLMVLKVKGALLLSIVATTIIGFFFGVTQMPEKVMDVAAVGEVKEVAFAFFGDVGFSTMFADPARVFIVIATIVAFVLSDMFDTIGTFLGTGSATGIFTDEQLKTMQKSKGFQTPIERGLFADVTASAAGALLGTSNVTTYVESASGIGAGGRTGFTSVVTAIAFALCLPFAPLVGMVPAQATAPILIIVGVLMMSNISKIKWDDIEEAIPAFLTILVMPVGYSITNGIATGCIAYCLAKGFRGKFKEIHPALLVVTLLFIANFIMTAFNS